MQFCFREIKQVSIDISFFSVVFPGTFLYIFMYLFLFSNIFIGKTKKVVDYYMYFFRESAPEIMHVTYFIDIARVVALEFLCHFFNRTKYELNCLH